MAGYYLLHLRTTRAVAIGRMFLENNDPKPPVELIKKTLKIYPYQPGGFGTSIGTALEGKVPLLRNAAGQLDWSFLGPQPAAKFTEGTGKVMNTIPPNDFSYFEMINALVQKEPADSLDPEIMGSLAAIGIVKGKPFNPDARMRRILTSRRDWHCHGKNCQLASAGVRGFRLLSRFELDELSLRRRLQLRDSAAGSQFHRSCHALSSHRLPHAERANGDVLLRHLRHARNDHASDRDRLAVPRCLCRFQGRVFGRRQDL